MLSLHQLRCFLATYEHGSLTGAAEELGYAQPSVSEQIRNLERSLDTRLFRRVGRGVVPTTVAEEFRPYAERTLAAADEARRVATAATELERGTIRFGMFGIARLYAGADLVADVLARHPGVRVELVGQNSSAVQDDLRRGRVEVGMIATAGLSSDGLTVRPVARDELVYLSADPERTASPVTAARLGRADLVMPETTYRAEDSTRRILRAMLIDAGHTPRTRIEVEDVETAVELAGMGLADTIIPRGAADQLVPRLAPRATTASLRPRQYDTFAVVHRHGAVLSRAGRLMADLATARIRAIAEPL